MREFLDLLGSLGIKRVVCVDDRFNERVDVETIAAWAGNRKNENALKGIMRNLGKPLSSNRETLVAELREMVQKATAETWPMRLQAQIDREILKSEYKEDFNATGSQEHVDRLMLHRLEELMGGFENYRMVVPEDWQQHVKKEVLGWVETERILILFDEVLGNGYKTGTKCMEELAANVNSANMIMVLLSYAVPATDEHAKTRELMEMGIEATAVSKRDLSSDSGFTDLHAKLRSAVLCKESLGLRKLCKAAAEAAVTETENRVQKLTPLEYDEVFFASSKKEGVHEMDTVIRVYANAFASKFREMLRGKDAALEQVDKLRSFRGLESDIPSKGSWAWKLQREEYYESGDFVNSCFMPVQIGDVFSLDFETGPLVDYVLVGSPCDVMVRSSGTRKKGIYYASLCKIMHQETTKTDETEKLPLNCYDELNGGHSGVVLAESVILPLWVLDLCAYNADGLAAMRLNATCPCHLSEGRKEYYAVLQRLLAESRSEFGELTDEEDVEGSRVARNAPIVSIWHTPEGGLRHAIEMVGEEGYRIVLGITRKMRLSPFLARELVDRYARYVSRPARPHSLSLQSSK